MDITNKEPEATRKARAKGRWKLLQKALLSKHEDHDSASTAHSKRSFPGYQMLESRVLDGGSNGASDLKQKLSNIQHGGSEQMQQEMVLSILALRALSSRDPKLEDSNCMQFYTENQPPRISVDCLLREQQSIVARDVVTQHQSENLWSLAVHLEPEGHEQYCIREYQLPNNHHKILTRERKSSNTKLSLQELVSHHTNAGVDNTGNICVWDCALTLAWALQHEQDALSFRTVLELGAGMAAITALSLAVANNAGDGTSRKIYITDGHADCVLNNRVNMRLMMQQQQQPGATIDCRQLLWTTDVGSTSLAADLVVVADCTHFQEYHAALFWTAVSHTGFDHGQIWMCQPDRGNSLQRFLTLIEVVNRSNLANGPLLQVTERHYDELDAKHQTFADVDDNNHYDPNLHRPRIFVLTKLRDATEDDRLCAIQHCQERDNQ